MRTVNLLGAVDLPARASSVPLARAFVRGLLNAAKHLEAEYVELLVTELLTNAMRHSHSESGTHGTMRLVVTDSGAALRVEVTDEGSATTAPEIPAQVDPFRESGRGLWLVRELSSSWGWREAGTGRVVWFEMEMAGA